MTALSPLLDMLAEVPDSRRAESKLYQLPHALLFSILAIVTGCDSYRGIVIFIEVHLRKLKTAFGLKWRRAPAHTALVLAHVDIAQGISSSRRDRCRRSDPAGCTTKAGTSEGAVAMSASIA